MNGELYKRWYSLPYLKWMTPEEATYVLWEIHEKDVLRYGVHLQFPATNNKAEYEAVLASLRIVKALGIKNLKLRTDSKLVVRQITNEYEAKEERMKKYLKLTTNLLTNLMTSSSNKSQGRITQLLTRSLDWLQLKMPQWQQSYSWKSRQALVLTGCRPSQSSNLALGLTRSFLISKTTNSHLTSQKQRRLKSG